MDEKKRGKGSTKTLAEYGNVSELNPNLHGVDWMKILGVTRMALVQTWSKDGERQALGWVVTMVNVR